MPVPQTRTGPRACRALALASLALTPLACGGGGGGSGSKVARAESAPTSTAVIPAQGSAPLTDPGDGFAPDADYFQDLALEETYDPSLAALGEIRPLLRSLGRSGSVELFNAGTYRAQIAVGPAAPGQDLRAATTQSGRTFAAAAPDFELWSVDSRGTGGGPNELSLWIPRTDPEHGAMSVFVESSIQASVDEAYPFGRLELAFAGASSADGLAAPFFEGVFEAFGGAKSRAGFRAFEASGDVTSAPLPGEHFEEIQAAVELDVGRTSGRARVFRRERFDDGGGDSGIVAEEWLLEFDATSVVRGRNGAAPVAFRRDEPMRHVWRYGLYESAGARAGMRVDAGSGFGFETAAGEYGWVGPWGLWLPAGVTVADGETLARSVAGESGGVSYTARTAPGRLIRLTRHELDLARIDGESFDWFEFDATTRTTSLVRITYDAALGMWLAVARFDEAENEFELLAMPEVVDVATEGALALHSESLGGPVSHVHGASSIAWYDREVVDGSDPVFDGGATELELFAFVDPVRPAISAAEAEAGDIWFDDASSPSAGLRYVFQRSDLTLYHDASGVGAALEAVVLADGAVPASGPFRWGMTSGPLIPAPSVPAGTVPGVWDADVVYVWETGANPWNRFSGVTDDAGEFVQPPAPERFLYEHSTANDRNALATNDGRSFVLWFEPELGLAGIPRAGVDLDLDGDPDRYLPEVSLADGVRLGPMGREVRVRGLALEELLEPDPAYAGTLDLLAAGDLVVPGPDAAVTPAIGPAPALADPPRVVAGVIVEPPL